MPSLRHTALVIAWLATVGGQFLCSGQGINPASTTRGVKFDKILLYTKKGAAFRQAYATSPERTCSTTTKSSKKSLCAASASSEEYTQLVVATSPAVYDARTDAGAGFNPIGPVGDQRPCQTAVAFAVTAVAEAAVASALQINGSSISLSQQDLQFCPGLQRGCYDNWDIKSGLERLVNSTVVDSECLPYTAAQSDDPARLCNYRCRDPPKAFVPGKFGFTPLRDVISAQKQIRRYGAFVTRFNLYDDFFQWIAKTAANNPDAVYECPSSNTPPADGHAVAVVGYNNIQGYWIVKNSWGTYSGNKGFFKVKFGVCGMMMMGDTYGVYYIPEKQRVLEVAGLAPASKTTRDAKCYIYKANKDDYPSKIADRAVVNLGQLLADNIGVIRNLDKSIAGLRLRLCGPDPASVGVALPQGRLGSNPPGAAAGVAGPKPGATKPEAAKAARSAAAGSDAPSDMASPSPSPPPVSPKQPSPSPEPLAGEVEAQALLALKTSLGNPPGLLWQEGTYPCGDPDANVPGWNQVYCSTFAGQQHVYLVDLSSHGLSGSLDDSIDLSSLSRLQALWMSGNQLSGSLPGGWSKCKNLQEIKLEDNDLSGSLPAEWGDLTKLKRLYLNGNKLTGQLPEEWEGLRDLEYLFLASNNLSGTIPSSWANLSKLAFSSVFDNPGLAGCLPFDWNARADRVKLSSGPEAADGSATPSLTGTCLCGYCRDPASTQCDGTAASATCDAGTAGVNGTSIGDGSGNATVGTSGASNSTDPGDDADDDGTAGDYPAGDAVAGQAGPDTGPSGPSNSSQPESPLPDGSPPPGSNSSAAGGVESAAVPSSGLVSAAPGAAGSIPGTVGGAAPGTVGATSGVVGATSPGVVGTAQGAVGAPPGLVGSTPGVVGATPGVVGSPVGALGVVPGEQKNSVPVALPPPAQGIIPSFGGVGTGKPLTTTDDPDLLLVVDHRKENLMEANSSSSSSSAGSTATSTDGELS